MNKRAKAKQFCMIFAAIMVVAGLILMYTGNDALVWATENKEGILNAEQLKVSFNSVGGRITKEYVQEAQEVKKGDILMEIDSTDTDLAIKKIQAQLAQLDAQIKGANGGVSISMMQAILTVCSCLLLHYSVRLQPTSSMM